MEKSIVVPVDFSPAAENAAYYALNFANVADTNIILLHVWNLTAMNGLAGSGDFISQLVDDAEKGINDLKQKLVHKSGNKIIVQTQVRQGYFIEQLKACCNELQNVLVIMGAHVTNKTERIIFGSNTLAAMRHISWPLIILPNGVEFTGITVAGLACDLEDAGATIDTGVLKSLFNPFHPQLDVLHVTSKKHGMLTENELKGVQWIEKELTAFKPAFYYMQNENIEEAIRDFSEKNNLSLLIIIPKKHGLFNRLLHKSHSKQMIINTHIPVMSIHE